MTIPRQQNCGCKAKKVNKKERTEDQSCIKPVGASLGFFDWIW